MAPLLEQRAGNALELLARRQRTNGVERVNVLDQVTGGVSARRQLRELGARFRDEEVVAGADEVATFK